MIKAISKTPTGPLVVFGLSARNMRLLKEGRPILIDMSELGQKGHVMIFAGDTEGEMMARMGGLVGPKTVVKGMKN